MYLKTTFGIPNVRILDKSVSWTLSGKKHKKNIISLKYDKYKN